MDGLLVLPSLLGRHPLQEQFVVFVVGRLVAAEQSFVFAPHLAHGVQVSQFVANQDIVDHHVVVGLRVGVGPASVESFLIAVEGELGRGLIVALVADSVVEQALTEVDGRNVDTVLLTDDPGLRQGFEGLGVVEEKEEIDRPFPQQSPHLQPLVVSALPPIAAFGGPVEVEHG